MIREISAEIMHVLMIVWFITWGLFFCDIYNRDMIWDERYQSWEYNLNPQEGNGFYDAMIKSTK